MLFSEAIPGEPIEVAWNLTIAFCDSVGLRGTPRALAFFVGALACIIIPYLLGSINPAIIFSKLIYHDDIRQHGSGNAGTTNMLRTFGLKAAALTMICDFLKAILAVWLGRLIYGVDGGALAMFFVVFGHMFPIFYRFKGGKGVACAGMAALAIHPVIFLFLLFVFLVVAIGTRLVSLASIMCALVYPMLFYWFANDGLNVAMAFCTMAFVLFMHRENFKRIWAGKESKLDLSKFRIRKKKKDGEDSETPGQD
ncbi:MAG: glycerol-3-phosphate 1-O-acyltransferase PlsY [Clostridia bacterium]|nr:glycerol-3-phosphate 1-O-acyltransferase PlsY [Clostridia bacterium]